ncbi:unnamed protein product [Meloidogyne enterolobii]|uniref:Uncharacterized protein n=1 Tax=Meloidogyne enterolobii TaxID=390850 RepID=A0ACB0XK64_MELEN
MAFKTYIRPILEYSSVIWNPKTKKHREKLEKVQKWYTRVALFKCKIYKKNYIQRLKLFNLESLALRRVLFDLSTIFKIIKNHTHFTSSQFFMLSDRPNRNRHNYQIKVARKTSKTEHWIFNRSINLWNALPIEIVNIDNYKLFWNSLRSYLIELESTNDSLLYYRY